MVAWRSVTGESAENNDGSTSKDLGSRAVKRVVTERRAERRGVIERVGASRSEAGTYFAWVFVIKEKAG